MRFIKFHGYGNDYIVCEVSELAGITGSLPAFVRDICDRHYGAGADGVATIERLADGTADFALRIFNADGSEAAMSGNGSRSAASFAYFADLWTESELRFRTRAGVKMYRLLERDGHGRFRFAAEIGQPSFKSASIPMLTDEPLAQVRDYGLELAGGETVRLTALQMCNPNACVFVEDFDAVDWRGWGRAIESHARFPEHTNVEFLHVRDRTHIEARVWERGVGETLSSGTGACASAVAACLNELTERHVTIEMPGGHLEVEWREDGEVILTGEAEVVYLGEWVKSKTG